MAMPDRDAVERKAAIQADQDARLLALIRSGRLPMPGNELLANALRRRGDLPAAFAEYARLHAAGIGAPGVAQFAAMSAQRRVPARVPEAQFGAAPFVILDDFLDPGTNRAALDYARMREGIFTETELQKADAYGQPSRASLVTYDVGAPGAAVRALVAARMPLLCERLDLAEFPIGFIQLKIAAYKNGDFFRAHQDNGLDHPGRRISFVYYFHQEPKPYTGGDLLLYDTRFAPRAYVRSVFTRFIPRNNSLIAFPSEFFHEVSTVATRSAAFGSCRFTLAGHAG